jgi:hypothetical protein
VSSVSGCAIAVSKPAALPSGECIELVWAQLSASCPVADATSLLFDFKVKAKTGGSSLSWRRSEDSFDAVYPASGTLASDGATVVSVTDVVLADRVTFEVVDEGGKVRLRFTLRHR